MPIQKAKADQPDGDFNAIWNAKWADKIQSPTVRGVLIPISFVLAQGAPATVGVNKTPLITMPFNCTITKVLINAKTAPTSAALIVDINKNGTSIWSVTQANRIQLAAAATSGSTTTFDTSALNEGDILTVDIDQIGASIAGQDISVILVVRMQ